MGKVITTILSVTLVACLAARAAAQQPGGAPRPGPTAAPHGAHAGPDLDLRLPAIFTDHMVLQRDMPVPIWGTAAAGAKVTVKFRGQEKSTTAGPDGKWRLKLDPLAAGGPDKLTVNSLTLDDVLVGEVWVGSGQSNMAIDTTNRLFASDVLLATMTTASYPELRMFTSSGGGHDQWKQATPANNPKFSALLFAFGVPLQKELHVPVGLLLGAVGGTPSGMWLREEAYRSDPACTQAVQTFAATYPLAQLQKQYEADKAAYDKALAAAKEGAATKPAARPPRAPSPPLLPGAAPPQEQIGSLYEARIRPLIPYAIRGVLWDQGESGTSIVGVDQYTLMGTLIRSWRQDWGQGEFPFLYVQKPSGGGPAWDYDDPVTGKADKFVPLTTQTPRSNDNSGPTRETHIKIMKYPGTFMVSSSDLGGGIHPTNKSGYGARAARVALGAVYGRKLEIYGPLYDAHTIEGNKIRITFTHVGAGLAFRNGAKLQGFAIAGADQKFVWADATIDGASVVVSSPAVPKPVVVRYAWSEQIPWANLFNKDGLPAQAFRTDAPPVTPGSVRPATQPASAPAPQAEP